MAGIEPGVLTMALAGAAVLERPPSASYPRTTRATRKMVRELLLRRRRHRRDGHLRRPDHARVDRPISSRSCRHWAADKPRRLSALTRCPSRSSSATATTSRPSGTAAPLAGALPDATLHLIRTGHMLPQERPQLVTRPSSASWPR